MTLLRRLLCISVMTVLPLSAFAWGKQDVFSDPTPLELQMTSVPIAPGAPGVILQWDHKQDDFGNWESEYVRIKVFNRDAAKYGDIELPYVPGATWIKEVQARTTHADGTVAVFDGKTYDKLLLKASGVKLMAKTFSLPDIQPGSILEYYYVRAWRPDELFSSHWAVQHELPVLKETIWLKPYTQGVSSFFAHQNLPAGKAPQRVGDHFELALENLPPVDDEPFMPPKRMVSAHVDFYYTHREGSVDEYWKNYGKDMAGYVEDFIGDRSYVKQIATEAIGKETTDEAKLRKLYARAQQLRNLSYEPDKTDKETDREKLRDNKSAEDVLRNGYGWRSEITRTFVALARAAGFDAHIVRAASCEEWFFAKQLPDASQLNTEVAMVNLGGQRFFDPGTPFAPFGVSRWELTGVAGMLLAKKGESTFLQTANLTADDALLKREADLRIDGDTVKGTVTITATGEQALVRRLHGRNDDEAKNRKTAEDEVKKWLPEGSTVKLKSLGPLKASDEPLVAVLDVELPNLGSFAGSRALLPLAVFSSAKNPFSANTRKLDIYFGHPSKTQDEVTLHVPDGYVIESMPHHLKNDAKALVYETDWSQKPGTVTLKRTMTINNVMLNATSYAAVRTFYTRVASADQDNLVLKKATATAEAK